MAEQAGELSGHIDSNIAANQTDESHNKRSRPADAESAKAATDTTAVGCSGAAATVDADAGTVALPLSLLPELPSVTAVADNEETTTVAEAVATLAQRPPIAYDPATGSRISRTPLIVRFYTLFSLSVNDEKLAHIPSFWSGFILSH